MGLQPRQHTLDVPIQDRHGGIECAGENAPGRGATDARQRQPGIDRVGPWMTSQQLCRFVQPAGTGVITKPLPLQPYLLQRCRRQGFHRWKGSHPPLPVGEHHRELSLLKHHLGNPDAIGIETFRCRRPVTCGREHPGLLGWVLAAMPIPPGQ